MSDTLSASTVVRIQARLVESGKVEFGLQLDGDRVWLPRARLFPYSTAEVGRWLFSSPYPPGDSTGETYCPDGPTHDGERWCVPPPSGDTIQLFSDWGQGRVRGALTRCGGVGYEAEPYYDSGDTWDENARVCRTLPLTLRVGTIIEDYDTNGRQYAVRRVTRIGDEPWDRGPTWTDVVYPVYLCSQRWRLVDGYEDRGFLVSPTTREVLYEAWQDPDGRYRLLLAGRVNVSDDC